MLTKTKKLSHSESGKIGAAVYAANEAIRKKAREDSYLLNPKLCKECLTPLSYDDAKRKKVFCNHSCSATHTNNRRSKKIKIFTCLYCGKEGIIKKNSNGKYCDIQCQAEDTKKKNLARDTVLFEQGLLTSNRRIKTVLSDKYGYKCACCGISKWNNKPIVLEVEHKDGNSENNNKENLELICPNCHSQTPTYKGANRGNGRHSRRQRYAEGKSF